MTKRILVLMLAVLLVASVSYAATGSISGNTISNVKLQLRDVDTGQLVGTAQATADGAFSFTGLNPGNYVVEIVDASGKVIGTSAPMTLASGTSLSGVTPAVSSSLSQAKPAGAVGGGSFWTSTGGILLLVGIGVGVTAGIIAATNDGSPSR